MPSDIATDSITTRTPLTRERIIEAAATYADQHGIDELSMRKLGTELGVEAMSLYNHVENKDDIFDGMIDWVFEAIPLPDAESDWRQAIRATALMTMDRFSAHPWAVSLLMMRGNYGSSSLYFMDRILGILRAAGFSDEDTHHAWQMLAGHTMGYAFQQASSGHPEKDLVGMEQELSSLGDRFPHVAELAPYLARCEFATEFAFGLDIIIDGLNTQLVARR